MAMMHMRPLQTCGVVEGYWRWALGGGGGGGGGVLVGVLEGGTDMIWTW